MNPVNSFHFHSFPSRDIDRNFYSRRPIFFRIFTLLLLLTAYLAPISSGGCWFLSAGISEARAESGDKAKAEKKKNKKDKKKSEADNEEDDGEKPKGADDRHDHKSFDRELNEDGAIDAVLLLDSSRSMQRTDPKRLRDQGAKLFNRLLGDNDRVALVQFDRDARTLTDFIEIRPETVADLDKTIEGIAAEGGFTDLEAPLDNALALLNEKGRPKAVKAVILLSDGKMDPHPSVGTPQEATDRTIKEMLPKYKRKGYKIYTLSFSDESDAELLARFATDTNGIHWTAKDVETLHAKFSELFLALKKPQISPIEKGGFEIDSSVKEATFYITRKDPDSQITILPPDGIEISSTDFPPGAKWFHGERFDVITIKKPTSGTWFIHGVENPEGFASLLTDIKLQVKWPETALAAGDRVSFYARLTDKGEVLPPKGIGEVTLFNYKIVDSKGESFAAAEMNDKGEDGDAKAGDGIYSATVRLPDEGEFSLITTAASTFDRQQRIPFNIAGGVILLQVLPGDDFEGKEEQLKVQLKGEALQIKAPKISIMFKEKDGDKSYNLVPKPFEEEKGAYVIPASKVPQGTFEAVAKVSGLTKAKKELKASSPPIEYVGSGKETEEAAAPEEEDVPKDEGTSASTVIGLILLLLSICWAGGGGFYVFKHSPLEKGVPSGREPWTMPAELAARIKAVRDRSSAEKRQATNADLAVFQIVADALGPIDIDTPEPPESAVKQSGAAKEEGWDEPSAEASS